jgi:hypothetical protein
MQNIFNHPHIVYRIAWYIDDHRTYYNFAQSCRVAGKASVYWQKPKQTQFSRQVSRAYTYSILPNGELHGYMGIPELIPFSCYYTRGIKQEGSQSYYGEHHATYSCIFGNIRVNASSHAITLSNRNVIFCIEWCRACDKVYYGRTIHECAVWNSI